MSTILILANSLHVCHVLLTIFIVFKEFVSHFFIILYRLSILTMDTLFMIIQREVLIYF